MGHAFAARIMCNLFTADLLENVYMEFLSSAHVFYCCLHVVDLYGKNGVHPKERTQKSLLLLLSAAPLRVATADISAQKIWQCFTPDVLPHATY